MVASRFNGKPQRQKATSAAQNDRVERVPIGDISPAPQNNMVYRPINSRDPDIICLSNDIRRNGLLQPIGITSDNVIFDGHRRYAACQLAGLATVKVRRSQMHSSDPKFMELLVSCNNQRVKTVAESIREEIIRTSPEGAIERLHSRRKERLDRLLTCAKDAGLVEIDDWMSIDRSKISHGKQQMLQAAIDVLSSNRNYWPLSLRQIHYRLLNAPPLRNTDPRFPTGRYKNDDKSYKDLSDLLTRARISHQVPWESIIDETRPVSIWTKWSSVGSFVRDSVDDLFRYYRRDLLQSQPTHIEIVAEKLTVQSIVDRVASEFTANVLVGRGFSSITARYELVRRFRESGKDSLTLLVLSDFDPEGESIAKNLASSIRNEFGLLAPVNAHKVAITEQQINDFALPPGGKAKKSSSRYKEFVRLHGEDVYELEALAPAQLQDLIRDALVSVIDPDLLEQERQKEQDEARELEARRRVAVKAIGENSD